jgi:hypothetical protein
VAHILRVPLTVSSVLRASHTGQQLTATSEGAQRVTTSDTCRSGNVAEVVLGVDTHLDFHVAVALDQLWADPWSG